MNFIYSTALFIYLVIGYNNSQASNNNFDNETDNNTLKRPYNSLSTPSKYETIKKRPKNSPITFLKNNGITTPIREQCHKLNQVLFLSPIGFQGFTSTLSPYSKTLVTAIKYDPNHFKPTKSIPFPYLQKPQEGKICTQTLRATQVPRNVINEGLREGVFYPPNQTIIHLLKYKKPQKKKQKENLTP